MHRTLLALALVACTGNTTTETTAGGDDGQRGMLVVASATDIHSLVSVVSTHATDRFVFENLFYPTVDYQFDCELKHEPGLATEWSWSEDGKTLSMTLRDDIKYDDGTPITADDIAFTYELVNDPKVASPRISHIERLDKAAMPKVVDPTHIEWHFTEAYDRSTQLSHVNLHVVPRHVFGEADRATLKGHDRARNPPVSGPWKILEHKPNERYVLAPNEGFTGPEEMKPKLKRVLFKFAPEYQTRLLQLKSGEVDLMESIQISDVDDLRKNHPEIKLVRRGYRSMDYLAWNLKDPLFEDVEVRRALAHAANIPFMMDKLLKSKDGELFAKQAVGTITPELCAVVADDVPLLQHDVDKAKALLAEAGWKDTDGDGILDKGGKKFSFTLITNRENQRRMESAVLLQQAFGEVGVDMQINTLEFGTMTDLLKQRKFQAVIGGWSAGLFVDPGTLWHSDTEERKYEFNYPSYSNAEVDALIDKGMSTPDIAEATPIWQEMQAKIYEDQPYLFLWWRDEIVGVHERFENAQINVASPYYRLHDWEVPADKVKYDF